MKLQISSLDPPLRITSVRIMIIMKEFLFYILCFISLNTNLKLSMDIFIMSKFIEQVVISSLSAAGRWSF